MKLYKVIWFDDECNELAIIKEKASLNGIKFFGYSNSKEGIEEIEKNIENYDAAVVDGNFHQSPNQSGDNVNDKALFEVGNAIERLKSRKVLPWYILSGQDNFNKQTNRYADGFKDNKVYDKNSDADLQLLWNDLKAEADTHLETQLRHDYSRVFDVCTERYIGASSAKDLLSILKKENSIAAYGNETIYFNPLRKIIEDLFTACNKWGLLPDVFIKGGHAFNESSRFLSGGVERGYQLDTPVFPKVVSNLVKNILDVCQPASHRSEIDSFIAKVITPYLLYSTTYQLLDVLLWFKIYLDDNSDVDLNKSRYKPVETDSEIITGIIEKDGNGNYHCSGVILTYKHFGDNGYNIGDKIRIIKTAINTKETTKQLYLISAISSEKI